MNTTKQQNFGRPEQVIQTRAGLAKLRQPVPPDSRTVAGEPQIKADYFSGKINCKTAKLRLKRARKAKQTKTEQWTVRMGDES